MFQQAYNSKLNMKNEYNDCMRKISELCPYSVLLKLFVDIEKS